MEMKEVIVHMNAGNGDTSYANNSAHQKIGILKALNALDESLKEMFIEHGFPKCFRMADLGCSSGPNTLLVIARVIDTVEGLCEQERIDKVPEFKIFLNDLPGNDFNNLFKMIPSFYQKLNQEKGDERTHCFMSGLPGSFYGRLLPSKSLNFVYSSFSLQWLSRIPEGLENNKENIHMAKASPPDVFEAYSRQYQRDFFTFLSSRGKEMIHGGRMVLTFVGRSIDDPSTKDDCAHFSLLAKTLVEMVAEGLVKEADLHCFNLPIYTPSRQEVEEVINKEGSFNLDKLQYIPVPWDAHVNHGDTDNQHNLLLDKYQRGELVSNFIRAYTEPILASHFGSSIIDDLYGRYAKKLAEHLSKEEASFFNIIVCLSMK